MSQLNNTLKLLNLKDKNVIFYDNYLNEGKTKGKRPLILKDTSLIRLNVAHVVPVFDKNIVNTVTNYLILILIYIYISNDINVHTVTTPSLVLQMK